MVLLNLDRASVRAMMDGLYAACPSHTGNRLALPPHSQNSTVPGGVPHS